MRIKALSGRSANRVFNHLPDVLDNLLVEQVKHYFYTNKHKKIGLYILVQLILM